MKRLILLIALACVSVASSSETSCIRNKDLNSVIGLEDASKLSTLANLQFRTSYKFLLLSMNFNSFLKDRPGFSKLFRQHSDKLFDDSIALVKHITNRGLIYDSKAVDTKIPDTQFPDYKTAVSELSALEKISEKYKVLIEQANSIWHAQTDPEIKHYVQEELLEGYTKALREVVGYYNNLNSFGEKEYKLGVYLFDEYLQKQ